jgi:NADH-quinone oxidoreductase subunit J
MNDVTSICFGFVTLLVLVGGVVTVAAKNPIRGAMGLMTTIVGIAGMYLLLSAEFLAAIQIIVYAGAVVVLFLFVIMLLGPSAATPSDRRGLAVRVFSGGLFGLAGLSALWAIASHVIRQHHELPMLQPDASFGGIDAFGTVLFSDALVPFELSSALLMVAVIGAVAVARGRQGTRSLSRSEIEAGRAFRPGELTAGVPHAGTSGVFSHEIHLGEPAHEKESPS